MQLRSAATALAPCLLILASCASVSVRKVPAATTYTNWTDADQRRADALEGVRFYMPRPYVRVKQPFIVAADVYLAHAIVAPDGRVAILTSITSLDPDAPRAPALPSDLARSIPLRSIPLTAIAARPSTALAPTTGGDIALGIADELDPQLDSALNDAHLAAAAKSAVELLTAPDPVPAESSSAPTTGREHRRVAVDNTALARTPLDGPFDILYLPDFDEQYVVSSSAKLGDTAVALDLGQGWSLQSLDSLADNRAINQRIYALLDDASRLGLAAARAAIMGPLPNIALSADPTDTDASNTTDSDPPAHVAIPAAPAHDAPPAPGTPLLLRITVLHTVAPGLYPVIKPRELAAAEPRERTFTLSLSRGCITAAPTPAPAPRHATTPVYPYSYLSFNTVQTLVIEQP